MSGTFYSILDFYIIVEYGPGLNLSIPIPTHPSIYTI